MGLAQLDTLPVSVTGAARIDSGLQQQIDAYVARCAPGLSSGDFEEAKRARDQLLQPLESPGFSVAFRQAYAEALWPTMQDLLASDDPFDQLAGMRLAGQAATERPTEALIERLSSDDAGVRVFAAGRLGGVIRTATTATGSVSTETVQKIVRALAERVRTDEELRVADASVRALGEATVLSPRALDGVRDLATRELAEAIGARLRHGRSSLTPDQDEMLVALRALGLIGRSVADANANPSAETSKSAVGAGGDAIGYILARFDADLIGEDKTVEVRLVRAAQTAFFFGRQRHAEATGGSGNIPQPTLDAQLEGQRPREFRNEAIRLLGPASSLIGEFGFKPDRFIGG